MYEHLESAIFQKIFRDDIQSPCLGCGYPGKGWRRKGRDVREEKGRERIGSLPRFLRTPLIQTSKSILNYSNVFTVDVH